MEYCQNCFLVVVLCSILLLHKYFSSSQVLSTRFCFMSLGLLTGLSVVYRSRKKSDEQRDAVGIRSVQRRGNGLHQPEEAEWCCRWKCQCSTQTSDERLNKDERQDKSVCIMAVQLYDVWCLVTSARLIRPVLTVADSIVGLIDPCCYITMYSSCFRLRLQIWCSAVGDLSQKLKSPIFNARGFCY